MPKLLGSPVFARLFAAQVAALLGTGLLTVALALLAFDLAGEAAGAVLGTALFIKMVAYVGLSPLIGALTARVDRKTVLVLADLVRICVALALPFVGSIWQIYLLIFILQVATASFTPAFQALIPDVLTDEERYTRALSLSRIAYDTESLLSPLIAGLLLLVVSFHWLFAFTAVGFVASTLLVVLTALPERKRGEEERAFWDRLTLGTRVYLATPRLRGLLALNFAAASAGAIVIVNTVVIVRVNQGGSETALATALGAFGVGSMLAALALPRLLRALGDRPVMMVAAGGLVLLCLGAGVWLGLAGALPWPVLLAVWCSIGMGYAAVLTPSGRLLRRSAHPQDRPALFTAQFALSHACWLVLYPLAGWGGSFLGLGVLMGLMAVLALVATLMALRLWPRDDAEALEHDHPELPVDHPHLLRHPPSGRQHRHPFVIDDLHPVWPRGA